MPHKFWNAGNEPLICRGWIKPAHNVEYFLTEIYNGGHPGAFDSAWLMRRYRPEFDMSDIPVFVKSVIFPLVHFWGKLTGQHKKFKDAPQPVC